MADVLLCLRTCNMRFSHDTSLVGLVTLCRIHETSLDHLCVLRLPVRLNLTSERFSFAHALGTTPH